ncbi:hypothetical protein Q7P37_010296 [Cladosporium fusiforme]
MKSSFYLWKIFLIAATAISMASSISNLISCCTQLDLALPGRVVQVSSPKYDALNTRRWSETAVLDPSCIVQVSDSRDVSVAIQILGAYFNEDVTDCYFSVKSGGHMAHPGANNIAGGVALDLGKLNHGSVVPNQQIVRLGAGGTWQNAYDMFPDILFPGGVCGETGVAGVALGGGMSLFLADIGWVANNIMNYEIVMADGTIHNVNATHHNDLYLALRGGGANYGIVTEIDLTIYKTTGKIYGGQILSPATPNVTTQVLHSLVDFTTRNNQDTHAGLQVVFLYDGSGAAMVDNLIAHTDGTSMAPIFDKFLGMGPQLRNTVGLKGMRHIAEEASALQPRGYRDLTATFTLENDIQTLLEIHKATVRLYESIRDVPDMDFIFSYVPLPSVLVKQSLMRGGDVMGLDRDPKDHISVFFSPRWKDDRHDRRMYTSAETWYSQVASIARGFGKHGEFLYHNFAGGFQDPLGTYGQSNVRFMRSVAEKYDPKGLFQTQMPGGFKLGNMAQAEPGLHVQG